MTDHTTMPKLSRIEVIETGARRRWTLEAKRRIVAESYSAPRQVSATARRHGLSASHLFAWRRLAREGRLGADEETTGFAQALIASEPAMTAAPVLAERLGAAEIPCDPAAVTPGRIEIVLTRGRRVIVDKGVDATALARVLAVLERP